MKKPNNIEIVNLATRQAKARLRMPFGSEVAFNPAPTDQGEAGDAQPRVERAALAAGDPTLGGGIDIVPQASDYIYPLFRALSQTVIEGYWIDYTKTGVLEASVPLLQGQTVYADHHFWNVEKWLGVVNKAEWDAEGAQSNGLPGINTELKIDAYLNPRIARGLMMTPPAIHSASVTILFEFEYSHSDLAEQGRFWDLLGEEVDDTIVRLIATKVLAYWELSLVFQGADRSAKQLPEVDDDPDMLTAPAEPPAPTTTKEKTTVKLPHEIKTALGLAHEGDEVPDEDVVRALPHLVAQAADGKVLLDGARAECKRQATLAIVGSAEGELNPAIAKTIDQADAETLQQLTAMYAKQAGDKLGGGRSSVESTAGQPDATAAPPRIVDTNLL